MKRINNAIFITERDIFGDNLPIYHIERTVQEIPVTEVNIIADGDFSVQKGNTLQLTGFVLPENATNQTLKWESLDTDKATVDVNGLVTAKKAGEVSIVATASNGVSQTAVVKVLSPCVILELDQSRLTLAKGESAQLTTKMTPLDCTDNVSWDSSNEDVATVEDGNILACSAGKAIITANTDNGKTATCQVTVTETLDGFYLAGVTDKTYTGAEIIQEQLAVTDGVRILVQGTDYAVTYTDNKEVGQAKVTVTGIGCYSGTLEETFQIEADPNAGSGSTGGTGENGGTGDTTGGSGSTGGTGDTTGGSGTTGGTGGTDTTGDGDATGGAGTTNGTGSTGGTGNITNTNSNNAAPLTIGKVVISKVKNVKKKKAKVTIVTVDNAEGYQIKYSLKSDMKSAKTKYFTGSKYTIKNLKKKKKYYIQVRAYAYDEEGEDVYGEWSSKKAVRILK